ncbi:MAG: lactate racemase domain-containing protein, partial [Synergistaceae bacterium]|nr:lactate racemase domain-containing protein [Synergistaceae bacterium]
MSVYELKIGREKMKIDIPDSRFLGVLNSRDIPAAATEEEAILKALANPIGSPRLSEKVKPGETVCIIICDLTRSWQHSAVYLPLLVEEIKQGGAKDEDIFFLVGTGTHRPHTPEEHKILVGEELYRRHKVIDHDSKAHPMT